MSRRYSLALDLKDDPKLIAAYCEYHEHVWPEVIASLREAGILDMEIYLADARLFMVVEVSDDFTWENKQKLDRDNPKVQEWERLMDTYQQRLPGTKPGEKWRLMERVFKLEPDAS